MRSGADSLLIKASGNEAGVAEIATQPQIPLRGAQDDLQGCIIEGIDA
jgi:hypothetical protein